MIVYFCDRELNISATASTDLPDSIRIISDTKTDDLESGVKTFDVSVILDDTNRDLIRDNCCVGNFVLRSADDGNEFYTIIETEHDTNTDEYRMYCEDAGLDLLNTIVPELDSSTSHTLSWYVNYYITNYANGWEIGLDESPSSTLSLDWDGESTLTERLISIANNYGCELGYSYEVEGLKVTKKYIDIYRQRGNKVATDNYYINKEVQRINVKKSIADLATAFVVTGGTPSGKSTPINLSGANYSSDGKTTHSPAVATDDYQIVGKQVRCISAMEKWRSNLDSDGLLTRQYSYDTTNKKELFSHAVAELRKVVDEQITYEIEFAQLDNKVGDRLNIIDDQNELYIEARILKLERSVTADTITATLGEYVQKSSGISDRLLQLAADLATQTAKLAETNEIANTALDTVDNTLSFMVDTDYSDEQLVTLKAHVFQGETEVTDEYQDGLFYWYSKSEDGVTALGDSSTITFDRGDAGFGTTVVCSFALNEFVLLITPDNKILTTPDGYALLVEVKESEVA